MQHVFESTRRYGSRGLLILALLPALCGCVMVVSPLDWFGGERALQEYTIRGEGDAKILVTSITGFISDRPRSSAFGLVRRPSTVARLVAELRKARKDAAVKAVIVRIDSPGGGVAASDAIYHRLQAFSRETGRPVIALLGGVAASGGYYIACAAETIIAHPTTITGSIGVIIASLDVSGLMDKLGLEAQVYISGPNKDLLSPVAPTTPEERRIINAVLHDLFQRFVRVVKTNRDLAEERMKIITDGRIFSARTALELGLVDRIGRLQDAIALAREQAGLEQARVVVYRPPGGAAASVYSSLGAAPGGGVPEIHVLPVDLPLFGAAGPRFLYLWRPGTSAAL